MIKVSILCLTYNQKSFVNQAIDSFLMQKTDFDFEVLIHDDASTDGTTEIIKKYQKKYPNIIKPIFQKENQFRKGKKSILAKYLLPLAKGKYISLCEGDDFFTDKNKLQIQSDFLDFKKEYSLCFHPVKVFYENKEEKGYIFPDPKNDTKFTLNNLLKENFIQTNSVMYRKQNYDDFSETSFLPTDWYSHIYHARFGKIGFIDEVMSSYRKHEGGIWWNTNKNFEDFTSQFGVEHLIMYAETAALVGNNQENKKIVIDNFVNFLNYYNSIFINKFDKYDELLAINCNLGKEIDRLYNIKIEYGKRFNELVNSKFFMVWQLFVKFRNLFI